MAALLFSTYGELKTSIADYLYNRADLTDRIPGFIRLAESRIYRRLRTRENQTEETGTVAAATIALPSDYRDTKILIINDRPLTRKSDIELEEIRRVKTAAGEPKLFARDGADLVLWPTPDDTYAYEHRYFQDLTGTMSADDDTNAVLEEYPDLYLYGALLEAMPFLVKDERTATWKAMWDDALASATMEFDDQEYSGSPVEVTSIYGDG